MELDLNVELASPQDFLPELPGWRERSAFIDQHGAVQFYHYDLHAQALSKIERGHDRDLQDVRRILRSGLIEPARLLPLLDEVKEQFGRYPAVDFDALRERVQETLRGVSEPESDKPGS